MHRIAVGFLSSFLVLSACSSSDSDSADSTTATTGEIPSGDRLVFSGAYERELSADDRITACQKLTFEGQSSTYIVNVPDPESGDSATPGFVISITDLGSADADTLFDRTYRHTDTESPDILINATPGAVDGIDTEQPSFVTGKQRTVEVSGDYEVTVGPGGSTGTIRALIPLRETTGYQTQADVPTAGVVGRWSCGELQTTPANVTN